MKALLVPVFVILGLVSAAIPLSAHHSWPVSYSQLVTVKGTVMEFAWQNPHPMITLEVRTPDGKVEKWTVGGPAINRMEANGWNKGTIKPGDVISATGGAAKSGAPSMISAVIELPDGRKIRS